MHHSSWCNRGAGHRCAHEKGYWRPLVGGYWWVLVGIGGIGATCGVDDPQGAPENGTNRQAVCVGLCRRLPAWGVLRRERQMYYNTKKGAGAVGATSGHCVRACAVELYQDQVSRPVWCERGGSAGVYGATAGTMWRQLTWKFVRLMCSARLGARNLKFEEKPSPV